MCCFSCSAQPIIRQHALLWPPEHNGDYKQRCFKNPLCGVNWSVSQLSSGKTLDEVPARRRSHIQRQTTIHTHIHQSMSLDCVLGSQSTWREIPPENSQWLNWAVQPLLRYPLLEMWVEIPLKCFLFSCAGRQCKDEHYAGLRRRPCTNLLQRQRH